MEVNPQVDRHGYQFNGHGDHHGTMQQFSLVVKRLMKSNGPPLGPARITSGYACHTTAREKRISSGDILASYADRPHGDQIVHYGEDHTHDSL
jgi:hypothetical protein